MFVGAGDRAGRGRRHDGAMSLIDVRVPSGTATITFGYIPQIYRHLKIFVSGQTSGAGNNANVQIALNNDTGANYDFQILQVHSTTSSASGTANTGTPQIGSVPAVSAPAAAVASIEISLFDYTNPLTNKTLMSRDAFQNTTGSGNIFLEEFTVIWHKSPTAPINRIDLTLAAGVWQKSVASLYGYQ